MSELKSKFKLYTRNEVAALFPGKDSLKKVEDLAKRFGVYRDFDGVMLFTEEDVTALLQCIAAAGVKQGKPSADTAGHIVFIGNRLNTEADVFMGWAPVGGVDNLVSQVATVASEKVELLDYAPATFGKFEECQSALKAQRSYGHWYYRTAEFNEFVNKLLPQG